MLIGSLTGLEAGLTNIAFAWFDQHCTTLTGCSPVQALDGGYLALLLAEAVRGKKLPAGIEQGIVASGFLLITAVGLLLVLRDTLNLTLGSTGL